MLETQQYVEVSIKSRTLLLFFCSPISSHCARRVPPRQTVHSKMPFIYSSEYIITVDVKDYDNCKFASQYTKVRDLFVTISQR